MTNARLSGWPFNSCERNGFRWRQPLLALMLSVTAPALADRASAGPDDSATSPVEFDIPAQAVSTALGEFARHVDVQLFFITNGFEHVRANAVSGTYPAQQALDLLLAGTGLAASCSPDSGIKVTPVDASPRSLLTGAQRADDRGNAAAGRNGDAGLTEMLEEIVVTGTQIRGTAPVGARLITLDRDYIELSGLATTQELIQTVPQNFGDGANEANTTVGLDAGSLNFGFSSSVNLRGLGADSTLVLLDGRRSAAGGGAGGFVDPNSIPVSAIERIEVLPDGASSIYGSDAIGGVVNVIPRRDYQGSETHLQYSPDINDIDEIRFSQLFGKSWDSGSMLVAYEFYDRGSLRAEDREYTRSSDLTPFGGTNHDGRGSNPGNVIRYTLVDGSEQTVLFPIPGGQDGTSLTPADLATGPPNLQNRRAGSTVLPEQTRNTVFVSVSRVLSARVELFAETRYSNREFETFAFADVSNHLTVPSTNPFFVDPFGGSKDLRIDYSYVADYGARRRAGDVDTVSVTLGATFGLSNSWELEVYGSYNAEQTTSDNDRFPNAALLRDALADPDPATAFNPFGDGSHTDPATLAAIEGFRNIAIDSQLAVLNAVADGELFELPGGAARLAIGSQFRDESLHSDELLFTSTAEPVPNDAANFDLDRNVAAAFIELYMPLVSERNRLAGVRQLQFSAAARYEEYSDFGGTFDPKVGVSWSPLAGLNIRGTAGTSFRAPLLQELNMSDFVLLLPARDPASATGLTDVLFLLGTGGDLGPQEATTWTAGIDIEPKPDSGFRAGVTYFQTEVDGVIQFPSADISSILQDPEQFAPVITRCPCDRAVVNALFDDPRSSGTPAPAGEVGAIVNARLQNIAKAEVSGIDLDLAYSWDSTAGSFDLSLRASRLFDFKRQLANGPLVDHVDTITHPSSLKIRSSLSWRSGGIDAAIISNHVGDYVDNVSSPQRHVSSWTTWDLRLGYEFDGRVSKFLEGAEASLNVRNVLDEDPPFVDGSTGVGFDSINANPIGRLAVFQLTKTW